MRIGCTTSGGAHPSLDATQPSATMIIESAWDRFTCEVGGMGVSVHRMNLDQATQLGAPTASDSDDPSGRIVNRATGGPALR